MAAPKPARHDTLAPGETPGLCTICPGRLPHPADPDVEAWMAGYRARLAALETRARARGRRPVSTESDHVCTGKSG